MDIVIRLIHGEALREMDKLISSGVKVDLIFTDLPYGTTNCKWDTIIDLTDLWTRFNAIKRSKHTPIVLFAQTPFDKVLGASNIKNLRYEWIWEKSNATGHLNSKKMPLKAHENLLVFYEKLPYYNPQKTTGHKRKISSVLHRKNCIESDIYNKGQRLVNYDSTDRYPRSVLRFPSDKQKSKLHPTQKPVALNKYMIETYTKIGDTVLDCCMGSASSGEASFVLGRNYIGIDNDIDIFNKAVNRINKA